ncbi:MAG: phenylalanine--tRNA ligase subunit beta, partial [Deltaproteobacteria bacterium]|nr:phenylalanine--tRNA ligase subunit beta [Deltaproteobacteria bacterium]
DAPPMDVAEKLVSVGFEVEGLQAKGEGLDGVVVARVVESRPHPKRENLKVVRVEDGHGKHDVVCGAPNVPEHGALVAMARAGATLPGGTVERRAIGGVESAGMLCSEVELGVGADASGLWVLDVEARPGQAIDEALDLHDWIVDLSIAANRPDTLGHIGLAREVAVAFGVPFAAAEPESPARVATKRPEIVPGPGELIQFLQRDKRLADSVLLDGAKDIDSIAKVIVESPARCPRYGAAAVVNVSVARSPFWLRYRLHNLGIRSISNVVDVTNLVLLEYGHPIHGFDLDALADQTIVVRLAREGETMKTLDGIERSLCADDLLICDAKGPVALAGVMGGLHSEVTDATTRVLIECAYFDPRSVRRTSRRLGIHTEASHRFERGVDAAQVPDVLAHAAALMTRLCGGAAVPGNLDVLAADAPRPRVIPLRRARAERVIGTAVAPADVERILGALGCEVERDVAGATWNVTTPVRRVDLAIEDDLVEEIIRIRGVNTVPFVLPPLVPSGRARPEQRAVRRLRELAVAAGLDEAMHHALVSKRDVETMRLGVAPVAILNPVSDERAVLRPSLLPSLAQALRLAARQGVERVRLFEVGRVFLPRAEGAPLAAWESDADRVMPEQPRRFAFALSGARDGWLTRTPPVDFHDGKGVLESILRALLRTSVEAVRDAGLESDAPWLHPRRGARIVVDGEALGAFGELHPDIVEAFGLVAAPVVGELDVERLVARAAVVADPKVHALPRFPPVTRDAAFVVDERVRARDVEQLVSAEAGELLERVELFDLYRGAPVPDGKKSLAFRLVFRASDRTLTDAEVDVAHRRVVEQVGARLGGLLRA